ncbi:MAG: tRNA (adenosine(37)-N6)-threonylcarbamoyltransferase complex dimerization subunit type 1 TsaB [Omnitrophica bacterium RIFOXYB12_FULL_50_7]|nr:MAG: tRNA (adenosine(37)-N6)-threonylcarbamoyltransferase complex dimerization subunit type 1 TsaB [Omnitrophica bacterium RIFOXYB12_FULL_50_7]
MVQGYMKHAENLIPVIDRLLKKEKMEIGNIDAFLISRGPGSFTGLRIGFATLKGFLAIHPKPCYGASSLDVIAAGIKGYQNLAVCLDARRGKLYTRSYCSHGKRWLPSGPPRVVSIDEMISGLPAGSWITGDGVTKLAAKDLAVVPEKNWSPRAATLIRLFEMQDPLLKKLTRPKEFLPVYLRSSEAEEKLKGDRH